MSASIPEMMQAVQQDESGGPIHVRQIPVPRPARGQVLIRMATSPINPSDLGFLRSPYAAQKPYPAVPGNEGSGTVVATGGGLLPRMLAGRRISCSAGAKSDGTWAEYMVTSATRCFALNKNISFEQGSMLIVNPLTALAFFEIAKREKHQAMVNTAAASALGRMIVRLGQTQGVPVINIVRRQEQVELLRSLGAAHVLNSGDADFADQLRALAQQLKATLFLDAIGGKQTRLLLENAPFGSTVLVYGNLSGADSDYSPAKLFAEDKRLQGFYLLNYAGKKSLFQALSDTRRVQRLAATELNTTIQKRLPLSSAQEALELYQQNMTAGKVLLVANQAQVALDEVDARERARGG